MHRDTPMPRWLNYHQLLYFRAVARAGSLAGASSELRLSPQTLSEHVQQLEATLGTPLFVRGSRGMTLTEAGMVALTFAEEIHALGQELFRAFEGSARPARRLVVGVDAGLPRLAVWALLQPVTAVLQGAPLVCRQGSHDTLIELLRARVLDVVLSESDALPAASDGLQRVALAESAVSWVAAETLANRLREGFPASMDGAPVVLPPVGTTQRRELEVWADRMGVCLRVVAELDDTALAKTACADGFGALAVSDDVLSQAMRHYGLHVVGTCEGVSWRVYGYVSTRLQAHPGIDALLRRARVPPKG
jgi:LysR family transcriptional activator of nhaA